MRTLSADVVRTAKRTILDAVGCAIGGYQAGPSQIAIKLAGEVRATPGATVFCSGIKTSQDRAVFANGVMIRYLDFNDGYITPMGGGHLSDALAALISTAEIAGRSGRDLIALRFHTRCSARSPTCSIPEGSVSTSPRSWALPALSAQAG
jgi:2-methylcitrate dehydratase